MDCFSARDLMRTQYKEKMCAWKQCNRITEKYGLTLTEEQLAALSERRTQALRDTGRVEFGEGILPRLIVAFCDSPYLFPMEYEQTLSELQELFYVFKGETELPDDELLGAMKSLFDGRAAGSTLLLADVAPEALACIGRGLPEREDSQEEEDNDSGSEA